MEKGFDGLKDEARRGRLPMIDQAVWQKVATLVVQLPEHFGLPRARWSVRELSRFPKRRYGWRVSYVSISRFLRSMALRPHRVGYWLNPEAPDFDENAAKICKLYVSPPANTTVLSLDEKPGIQALRRKHPTRPIKPKHPTLVELEYERKGTRKLFAAFSIETGQVLVWSTPCRAIPWLLSFLDQILE